MDQQNNNIKYVRSCELDNHKKILSTHICTYDKCNSEQRWVCAECIEEKLHHHGNRLQVHIMNKRQFIRSFYQKVQSNLDQVKQQTQFIQYLIQEYSIINQQIIGLIKQLEEDMQTLNSNYKMTDLNDMMTLFQKDFYRISTKQIDDFINRKIINFKQDFQKYQVPLTYIIQKLESTLKIIAQPVDQLLIQTFNYEEHFQLQMNYPISGAQISPDAKYLTYNFKQHLMLYFLKTNQVMEKFQQLNDNICYDFSNDSKFLVYSEQKGHICFHQLELNKTMIKQRLHDSEIKYLQVYKDRNVISITQENQVIISQMDMDKVQLNIQDEFKLPDFLQSIIRVDDYLDRSVICSSNKCDIILIFAKTRNRLLHKNAHNQQVVDIQFLKNTNKLISVSIEDLKLWYIDSLANSLVTLKQYKTQSSILNFSFIQKQQNIMLICSNYIQVLNEKFETQQILYHRKCSGPNFSIYLDILEQSTINFNNLTL